MPPLRRPFAGQSVIAPLKVATSFLNSLPRKAKMVGAFGYITEVYKIMPGVGKNGDKGPFLPLPEHATLWRSLDVDRQKVGLVHVARN